jgi:hypothetical protein
MRYFSPEQNFMQNVSNFLLKIGFYSILSLLLQVLGHVSAPASALSVVLKVFYGFFT